MHRTVSSFVALLCNVHSGVPLRRTRSSLQLIVMSFERKFKTHKEISAEFDSHIKGIFNHRFILTFSVPSCHVPENYRSRENLWIDLNETKHDMMIIWLVMDLAFYGETSRKRACACSEPRTKNFTFNYNVHCTVRNA